MGTLMAEKGIFDLLNAAARLAHAHPDARFVVAATWYRSDEADYAEKLVRDEGLGDRGLCRSFVRRGEGEFHPKREHACGSLQLPI